MQSANFVCLHLRHFGHSACSCTDYFDYASGEARVSETSMPRAPKNEEKDKAMEMDEDDSLSGSFPSQGSMNSEELATMLDYLANVEGGDHSVDPVARGSMKFGAEGMDMEVTENWEQTANDRTPKPRKIPRPKGGWKNYELRTGNPAPVPYSSKSGPRTPNSRPNTPKSRSDTPKSRNSRQSTPQSRQAYTPQAVIDASASSTPTSWGKKDSKRKGRERASPLPLDLLRARYSNVSFVVAVDPMSKLVDDDALIIVPHSEVTTAEILEASTADAADAELVSSAALEVPSTTIIEISVTTDPEVSVAVGMEISEEDSEEAYLEDDEDEEDEEAGEDEDEESSGDDIYDDIEFIERLEAQGAFDINYDDEEDEESGEYEEDDVDSDLEDEENDDENDLEDDEEEESEEEDEEDEEEDSEGEIRMDISEAPVARPSRAAQNPQSEILNLEKDLGISRAGMQMKHDSRRDLKLKAKKNKKSRENSDTGTGEFMSSKKLTKAEKKKQKKKDRDFISLEMHELKTWNELIRDFIERSPFGTAMHFSPMGRYQRKQLHWLSEFYGLRSQSFGSGIRHTCVYITKKTVVPDLALSLAALKAIHNGNHPFEVSSDVLQLEAEFLDAETHRKRRGRDSPAVHELSPSPRHAKKKGKGAAKSRSPLVRGGSKKGGKNPKSKQGNRNMRSHADEDDEEDFSALLGLDFAELATRKRVVGAGAAHIPESNVGHAMLKKLGWESGGLGKDEQGISQPIAAVIKAGRGGLGS